MLSHQFYDFSCILHLHEQYFGLVVHTFGIEKPKIKKKYTIFTMEVTEKMAEGYDACFPP